MNQNAIVLTLIQFLLMVMLQHFTLVDFMSLFQNTRQKSDSQKINGTVFKMACQIYLGLMVANLLLVMLTYRIYGYPHWSITMIPSAIYLRTYFCFVIILPVICNVIMIQVLFHYFSVSKTFSK